jgi:hypothetical protein
MPRRLTPKPLPRLPAGLVMSWPEVDLLISALHDASELQAALSVASGHPEPLDRASRYALLGARLGIARDAAGLSG